MTGQNQNAIDVEKKTGIVKIISLSIKGRLDGLPEWVRINYYQHKEQSNQWFIVKNIVKVGKIQQKGPLVISLLFIHSIDSLRC